MAYLMVIGGLMLLVFLHELGHFLAARAVGIRATKLYVGFPPAIAKVHRGDTEYGLGAIMLGGYVKLPGMFRPRPEEVHWRLEPVIDAVVDEVDDDDRRQRIEELFAKVPDSRGVTELGERLRELESAVPRSQRRAHKRIDDAIEDCDPNAYWRADLWRRMVVIFAGPLANLLIAFAIFWVIAMFFVPNLVAGRTIAAVVEGSPADKVGMQAGDTVVRWGGFDVASGADMERALKSARGEPVTVTLRSNSRLRTVRVEPTTIDGRKLVGVSIAPRQVGWQRNGPWEAAGISGRVMANITVATGEALGRLVTGRERNELGTVVGVVAIAPDVHKQNRIPEFLGLISLALAIFNLLPLLPLDGGHLLFGALEKVRRGNPVPRDVYERASYAGIAAMLILFVVGLQNDVQRGLGAPR